MRLRRRLAALLPVIFLVASGVRAPGAAAGRPQPAGPHRPPARSAVGPGLRARRHHLRAGRGAAALRHVPLPGPLGRGCARPGARQHHARDRLDDPPRADPRDRRVLHGGHAGRPRSGAQGRRAQRQGHRPPVVVGVRVSRLPGQDGQRAAHPGRPAGVHQGDVGRRHSQLLGAGAGREDGRCSRAV